MKKKNWLIVGILAVVTFLLGMLANSIMGRKAETEMISTSPTANFQPLISNSLRVETKCGASTTLVSMMLGSKLPTLLSALSI